MAERMVSPWGLESTIQADNAWGWGKHVPHATWGGGHRSAFLAPTKESREPGAGGSRAPQRLLSDPGVEAWRRHSPLATLQRLHVDTHGSGRVPAPRKRTSLAPSLCGAPP